MRSEVSGWLVLSVSVVMLRPLLSSKVAVVRSSSAVKVTCGGRGELVGGGVEVGVDDVAGDVELRACGGGEGGAPGGDGEGRAKAASRLHGAAGDAGWIRGGHASVNPQVQSVDGCFKAASTAVR